MAAFKKGEHVVYISSWDGYGTFYFKRAVVDSCGDKSMTLRDTNGVLLGRRFKPVVGIPHDPVYITKNGTFKDMTDEEALDVCLKEAEYYIGRMKAGIITRRDSSSNINYIMSLTAELEKYHEPKAIDL